MNTAASNKSFDCAPICSPRTAAWFEWAAAAVALLVVTVILGQSYDEAARVQIITLSVGALVAWIVVQDLKTFTIADGATVSIAGLALAERW